MATFVRKFRNSRLYGK